MHISVSFTKKEFDELLTLVDIGEYIRDGVLDDRGEYNNDAKDNLLDKLYEVAEKHTIPGIEKSKYREHTYIGPTSEREEATHAWVEEHDEENFWSTLCTRLARRDFFNTMTDDDRAEMEKTGWLPESAQKHFARYEQEFETYGVERVVIDENASIPSGLLLQ